MMRVERINAPTTPPVSYVEAKGHLRVTANDEDFDISRMTQAAARELEEHAQIALLTQSIRVTLNCWPVEALEIGLPIGPVQVGASLNVTVDGTAIVEVELGTGHRPTLRYTGETLSSELRGGRWIITYDAGFGLTPGAIPRDLVQAILDQTSVLFDQRGGDGLPNEPMISPHLARISARYRRVRL